MINANLNRLSVRIVYKKKQQTFKFEGSTFISYAGCNFQEDSLELCLLFGSAIHTANLFKLVLAAM